MLPVPGHPLRWRSPSLLLIYGGEGSLGGREAHPHPCPLTPGFLLRWKCPPESRLEMLQPLDWGLGLPFPQISPISVACGHFSVSVQSGSMARHCPLLSLGVLAPTGKLCTGPTCPIGPRTNSNWASWHEIVSGSLASGRAGFRSLVSGPTGYVTLCESCTIPAPGFLVCATEIRSSF